MPTLLVTGASGVVGRRLVERLAMTGYSIRASGRTAPTVLGRQGIVPTATGAVNGLTDWSRALEGCDAVVHLAAQVPSRGVGPEVFATVNDKGTARLVEQAKAAGAKRFIYLSSLFAVREYAHDITVDEFNGSPARDPLRALQAGRGGAFAWLRGRRSKGNRAATSGCVRPRGAR